MNISAQLRRSGFDVTFIPQGHLARVGDQMYYERDHAIDVAGTREDQVTAGVAHYIRTRIKATKITIRSVHTVMRGTGPVAYVSIGTKE